MAFHCARIEVIHGSRVVLGELTVVRILVLGPVELTTVDGTRVPLGGPKPKALLLALLQQRGRVVSRAQIVDLIWDESPPSSAHASVHTYVSALRRGIVAAGGTEATLATRAPGYLLDVSAGDTDLGDFTDRVERARRAERAGDFPHAAECYDAALDLWRGPALGGVDAGFARTWAATLLSERLDAEEGRARVGLELGRASEVVAGLTRLVAAHPLREESRGLLMRALHVSGRQAEALEVYRTGRAQLLDELGIEPGERLRALHTEILAGPSRRPTPVRTRVAGPATRPDDYAAPRNLPPDIGDFTGRDEDLAALLRMGAEPDKRTVVVSGFGGVGKSALAVHAAHLLSDRFPDGQLFADLRGAGRDLDAHEVLGRFLQAMGMPAAAVPASTDERVEQYRSRVAGRRLIIVLDNARSEHQVRPLLPGAPGSLVVITSRSRLTGLGSMTSIELDFLAEESAIAMLGKIIGADRVAAQRTDAERIAALCGGVPLAVRAAGAKLLARPHWPLRSLVVRLADERRRLDELTVGDLAIRSSLGLNYAELDDRQRRAFHLLCLLDLPDFGWWPVVPLLGVPPQDAEDIVEHLVDLRLVDVAGVDAIGRVRYRLHDLVQLFGSEQAVEEDVAAAVTRTLETWMVLVAATTRGLPRVTIPPARVSVPGIDVDPALVEDAVDEPAAWLAAEAAAVVRVVERAHDLGVAHGIVISLASLLTAPFATRNEFDAWQRTNEAALSAAVASADPAAEAVMLAGVGDVHAKKDDFPAALDHLRRARDLAEAVGDDDTVALALLGTGNAYLELAEFDAAVRDLRAAAELGERTGHRDIVAAANYGLGAISRDHGDIAEATERLTRCADEYREARDQRGVGLALRGLSLCHRAVADHAGAEDLAARAVTILTDIGDELGTAYARQSWAKAALRLGHDTATVATTLDECRYTCARMRDRFGVALMTRTIGELHLATGDLPGARETLDAALRLWTELDLPLWQARTLRDLAAATVTDDPETAGAQWNRARELCISRKARESGELAVRTPAAWLAEVALPTRL
jgi:DNA-binding SARP family transcriptional activator/tetratricopeptide (TPR) repeat protein